MASSTISEYSFNWGQTPPSGYHVPTSCIPTNGDIAPMQAADTRTLPAWTACDGGDWESHSYSIHRFNTTTLPDNRVETVLNGQDIPTKYVMPSACLSMCTIMASRVQLFYWPTPYPIPGSNASLISAAQPKTAVGPDGFTFVSPTAYVIYSGLSAEGQFHGTRTYENITRAYAPDQLSTFYSCVSPYRHSTRINFQDFNVPPRWSVVSAHQLCDWCQQQYLYPDPQRPGDALVTGYADMNFNQIPWLGKGKLSWTLEPDLAVPPGLTDLDPDWKFCTSFGLGVWDPPRTLGAVGALTPTATQASTSSSAALQTLAKTAEPASSVTRPLVSPTSTKGAIDPAVSTQISDPSQLAATHASSSKVDPPTKASPSPWPADPPEDPQGPSEGPTKATKGPSTRMPPVSLLDPVPIQDPPSGPNLEPTASRSPDSSPQLSSTPADMKSHTESPQKATTRDTTVDVIQGETGKASVGSMSNVKGSTSSRIEPTANVHPPTETTGSHNLPHIGPPYVLLTISPSDDGAPSHYKESAGAVITAHQATGTLTVPPDTTSTPRPQFGIKAVGQVFTPINANTVVVQDTSLSIGGEALTMHDMEVSMGSSGLVVGKTTIAMPSTQIDPAGVPEEQTGANHASTVIAGGRMWTFNGGSQIMADGVTLSKGSHAVTLDGTSFSFGSTALFAGTTTIPMSVAATATSPGSLVTAAGQTVEQVEHGKVLWSGITVTEGAPAITVHGSLVSYGSSGLILGTSTIATPSKAADTSEVIPLSAAGTDLTRASNSLLVVDGSTPSMGSSASVIDGSTMLYGSTGLDVSTATVSTPNSNTTASNSLGNIIMSGFGPGPAASATSVEAFKGAAVVNSYQRLWRVKVLSMGIGLGIWVLC